MKINNTEILYFIDYLNRGIHLLDLDRSGRMSLTNAIDPRFQQALIDHENLLQDVMDFEWYCYGTDGIIAVYRNYNFSFLKDYSIMHKPFVELMKQRRSR
jgi:hypothetical protein